MIPIMKLIDWLDANKLTNADFAQRIGVSETAVYRYTRGQRRPEWHLLAGIYLETDGQVTPTDFMEDRDFHRFEDCEQAA